VRKGDALSAPVLTFAVRPIALAKPEAAAALGMSVDSFDRHVIAEVRCVRRGRLRLYPTSELERWADENTEHLLANRREESANGR
jgi:hypothetical protein